MPEKSVKILTGILALAVLIFTVDSFAGRIPLSDIDSYPPVDLLCPVTQNIDLTGKTTLQFRWRQVDQARTDHYEFKLYQGYETVESTLLLKQRIAHDEYPFELPADNFKINQVYTWSLRQVYLGGAKNQRAISAFKIIKR